MRMLLRGDLKRQRLKVGTQNQLLVASEGSRTFDYGNELGTPSCLEHLSCRIQNSASIVHHTRAVVCTCLAAMSCLKCGLDAKILLGTALKPQNTIKAAVIIGKQSGSYLDGIAPDGLMGLGPGDISIPSLLVKSGLVPNSFSFCSDKSYGGSLFFGDKGPASQRSTPFLPLNRKLHVY